MSIPTLFIGGAWHTTTSAMVQETFDEIFGKGVVTKVDGVKRNGDGRDYMLFFIYTNPKATAELEKFIDQIKRKGSANVIYDDHEHFWKVQLNQKQQKKGKRIMSEEEEAGLKLKRVGY
jgi:hypothetical protein